MNETFYNDYYQAEKINIYVSEKTYNTLLDDAVSFEFVKKNKDVNKNALITTIIKNFYNDFIEKQTIIFDDIKTELQTFFASSKVSNDSYEKILHLSYKIFTDVNKSELKETKTTHNKTIHFRVTDEIRPILNDIEDNQKLFDNKEITAKQEFMQRVSISGFFCNLLTAYTKLSILDRERIVFKETYDKLKKAITTKKSINLILTNKNYYKDVKPYEIAPSKEELHYYLLMETHQICVAIRLSRIKDVKINPQTISFSDERISMFTKNIKYGPQYTCELPNETTKVILTPEGINMFNKIYINRPIPDFIENNTYYFNCSTFQVIKYFERFGKEAFVEGPDNVRDEILNFFAEAKDSYLTNMANNKK